MNVKQIYEDDLLIAKALINRDNAITRRYFYQQCYPLFKSIYENYYTDCTCCKEFIDEMYIIVLAPSKKTGKCQMENFKGESSLASWIKSACLFYCYGKYNRKGKLPIQDVITNSEDNDDGRDRLIDKTDSNEIDLTSINSHDVDEILSMMTSERYRNIIRLHYLEGKTNEEIAEILNMTMANFYNKKKLAIRQFKEKLNKGALYE